ncbi:MAG: hypothetical protein JWN63_1167 [Candidatus Acidoferrum typicum]|nr:hypothetical protein [Candidatus Acidoferrum typicum]
MVEDEQYKSAMAAGASGVAAMSSRSVTVSFEELLKAYEFASLASGVQAYYCINTGKMHLLSNDLNMELDEDLPADIETSDQYLCLPDKSELGLGRDLLFSFVWKNMPDAYDDVRTYFRKAGAYGRFKALLGSHGKLDEWYRFEEKATADALREWCVSNGLQLTGSEDQRTRPGNP